ncbi:hypothetical protein ABMA09_26040 (plasmid) [Erwinia rhapontici]
MMADIVNTYGKTWHTRHTARDKPLPVGIPALMMGFTADNQLDSPLLADRERWFGTDTKHIRGSRSDLHSEPMDADA